MIYNLRQIKYYMRKNRYQYIVWIALFCFLLCTACQDDAWDNHYGTNSSYVSNSLMEVLESQPKFSVFAGILNSTGLDSVLRASQSFTVWAPTNDALANYITGDNTIKQLLKNHIARYIYSKADLTDTVSVRVKMLNGKYQWLSRINGEYTFAGVSLNDNPIPAVNGVIFPINTPAPFYYNIWECMESGTETDSVYKYLSSFDEYTFLPASSTALGQNSIGQTVYDSVFSYKSKWMKKYGAIYLEDSIYTALIPTNKAWIKSYKKILPFFRTYGSLISDNSSSSSIIVKRKYNVGTSSADSIQDAHTKQTLVKDLVFRKMVDPYNCDGDSLLSTSGNVFHSPSYLFKDLNATVASNGKYYITDELKHKSTDSWFKKIKVEAEDQNGRTYNYATITKRSTTETDFVDSVSNMAYLEVNATGTNALFQPQVSFDIPDVLAGRYNIYAVFAPQCAFDSLAVNDITKVQFFINYVHEDGTMCEDNAIKNYDGIEFVTNGSAMTKFLVVKDFVFPYANYTSSPFSESNIQTTNVKVRVMTNVKASETSKYNRTMRIDYLLFEPVTTESNE
jgi:hypothetical protein